MKPTAVGFIRSAMAATEGPDQDNTFYRPMVNRASTELIFCIPEFFMLGTKCVNRVDWFASAAEILAHENRG